MRKLLLILLALLLPWPVFATTTLYVNTDAVSPSHPTYNHLADAITYLQGYNGGVLDDDFVIECSGATADTIAVMIDGITTTAANTLSVIGDSNGYWDDAKYKLHVTTTDNSAIPYDFDQVSYLSISNLQFTATVAGGYISRLITIGGYDVSVGGKFNNNIVVANSASIYDTVQIGDYPDLIEVYNNVIYGSYNGASSAGIACSYATSTRYPLINNNTIYKIDANSVGIDVPATSVLRNNIVIAQGVCYVNTPTAASNNISSDSTAPGSSSQTNQVATDLMTDPANGDFTLKAGSNAIGAGTDLSTSFTTDITGATRSAPWDIGAFAYAAAATGWAGKIYGITPAKIMGVPASNISKVGGL